MHFPLLFSLPRAALSLNISNSEAGHRFCLYAFANDGATAIAPMYVLHAHIHTCKYCAQNRTHTQENILYVRERDSTLRLLPHYLFTLAARPSLKPTCPSKFTFIPPLFLLYLSLVLCLPYASPPCLSQVQCTQRLASLSIHLLAGACASF